MRATLVIAAAFAVLVLGGCTDSGYKDSLAMLQKYELLPAKIASDTLGPIPKSMGCSKYSKASAAVGLDTFSDYAGEEARWIGYSLGSGSTEDAEYAVAFVFVDDRLVGAWGVKRFVACGSPIPLNEMSAQE